MNVFFKYLIGFLVGAFIGAACVLWDQQIQKQCNEIHGEVASIKWRQNHFKLNESNLYDELLAQGVGFPNIVVAQAILETGHFKSHACKTLNNLFGLRNNDGTYMSFEHWTDAVAAYKKYIQKYESPPDDYYEYLDKLDYAEDKNYTTKLKQIIKK
jgi:flagellum-specific peptidoglycan hydrolase FlgJ